MILGKKITYLTPVDDHGFYKRLNRHFSVNKSLKSSFQSTNIEGFLLDINSNK